MENDPIIEEIRVIRQHLQEEAGNDLRRLFGKLRGSEKCTNREKVSFEPVKISTETNKAA